MKNHTFANVIIQDLSSASPLHENFEVSQGIISEVVDGWNKDIYVIPRKALQINHRELEKYSIM